MDLKVEDLRTIGEKCWSLHWAERNDNTLRPYYKEGAIAEINLRIRKEGEVEIEYIGTNDIQEFADNIFWSREDILEAIRKQYTFWAEEEIGSLDA